MKMMERILLNLSRRWDKLPKDTPMLQIRTKKPKNIFDGVLERGSWANAEIGKTVEECKSNRVNLARNKNLIPIEPNKTYTFSCTKSSSYKLRFVFFTIDGICIDSIPEHYNKYTFTAPPNAYFFGFSTHHASGYEYSIPYEEAITLGFQLELGNQATSYEPYYPPSAHNLVTIKDGLLHLHSLPYRDNIPARQTIQLKDYTLAELAYQLIQLGYDAVLLTSEYENLKSLRLMEVENVPIDEPYMFTGFTSKLWEILYPIHALLTKTDQDIEQAIAQMYLPNARAEWLDYWATFFNTRRKIGESDDRFVRRLLSKLYQPRSNNIAIEELIKFRTGMKVDVVDSQPGEFMITIDVEALADQNRLSEMEETIREVKMGGIAYLITFAKTFTEDYKTYFYDRYGYNYQNADQLTSQSTVEFAEPRYGYTFEEGQTDVEHAFILNESLLNSGPNLLGAPTRYIKDEYAVIIEDVGGPVIMIIDDRGILI